MYHKHISLTYFPSRDHIAKNSLFSPAKTATNGEKNDHRELLSRATSRALKIISATIPLSSSSRSLMPLMCFACITAYGFGWSRLYSRDMEPEL